MTYLKDIPPPWKAISHLRTFVSFNRQHQQRFKDEWLPFWKSLSFEEKAIYLDQWEAPQDWRLGLAMIDVGEVNPPWVAMPETNPFVSVLGSPERYYESQWVLFLKSLTPEEREAYLERWEASEDWRRSLAQLEVEEFSPPWVDMPEMDSRGGWNQGLPEVIMAAWLPFWEILTPEEQDDYLERWEAPDGWRRTLVGFHTPTAEECEEMEQALEEMRERERYWAQKRKRAAERIERQRQEERRERIRTFPKRLLSFFKFF